MKIYAVVTGDIRNFTKLPDERRGKLVSETELLMQKMVKHNNDVQIFRGDSYQLITEEINEVLKKCVQLICWFKLNSDRHRFTLVGTGKNSANANKAFLTTQLSIGIGEIAYRGKNVLDSDGEAFHLSGRKFDILTKDEIIGLTTFDEEKNKLYAVVLMFINSIVRQWTPSQAETIFHLLGQEDNTQERVAQKLNMTQPAVALSLRSAKWKEVERGIKYISKELEHQYLL